DAPAPCSTAAGSERRSFLHPHLDDVDFVGRHCGDLLLFLRLLLQKIDFLKTAPLAEESDRRLSRASGSLVESQRHSFVRVRFFQRILPFDLCASLTHHQHRPTTMIGGSGPFASELFSISIHLW